MRVQYVSDLHLEFSDFTLDCRGTDVLVLAGDIHCQPRKLQRWLARLLAQYPDMDVVLVAGNHECFCRTVSRTIQDLRHGVANMPRVHFMENESTRITKQASTVLFVGGTLWCDPPKHSIAAIVAEAADFKRIHDLTIEQCSSMCRATCDSIKQACQGADVPVVVVTHFAPSLQSIHPKYGRRASNAYYATDLEHVICQASPVAWIHGHTHSCFDYAVGDTRVLCNPRGYSNVSNLHPENTCFNPTAYITIVNTN